MNVHELCLQRPSSLHHWQREPAAQPTPLPSPSCPSHACPLLPSNASAPAGMRGQGGKSPPGTRSSDPGRAQQQQLPLPAGERAENQEQVLAMLGEAPPAPAATPRGHQAKGDAPVEPKPPCSHLPTKSRWANPAYPVVPSHPPRSPDSQQEAGLGALREGAATGSGVSAHLSTNLSTLMAPAGLQRRREPCPMAQPRTEGPCLKPSSVLCCLLLPRCAHDSQPCLGQQKPGTAPSVPQHHASIEPDPLWLGERLPAAACFGFTAGPFPHIRTSAWGELSCAPSQHQDERSPLLPGKHGAPG